MYEVAKRSAALAAATGGLLLAGAACASADAMAHADPGEGASTRAATLPALGAADVLSGNSVDIPINIPANVCDIGLLGMSAAGASCTSMGAAATSGGGGTSSGTVGSANVLSGNSVAIPVTIPANVCGIGLLGMSAEGSACSSNSAAATGAGSASGAATTTSSSVLSGNSVSVPVTAPANLCDIGLLGMSAEGASCTSTGAAATGAGSASGAAATTSSSVLSGNSVSVPVTAPANLCDIGLLGMSAEGASCTSTGAAATGASGGTGTSGSANVLSGNSVSVPVAVPANVCGVGLLGMSAAESACSTNGTGVDSVGGTSTTTSTPSALSCNSGQAPAAVAAAPQIAQTTATGPVPSSALGTAEAVSLPLSSVVPPASSPIGAFHDFAATDMPFHPTPSAAHAGNGRLAETGVEGLLSMSMAGGGALLSGGVLTALAFKGKHDTTDF